MGTKSYLKIENPGIADSTAFTILGASTSRSSDNANTIGKFGSGNKMGVAVCLRNDAAPIVFAGNLRMTFGTTGVVVDTGLRTKTFARVNVKYGGKDRDGKNRSSTKDLGFVLEYGAEDWAGMDLALREFVSNSIDRAIEEDENAFAIQWAKERGITRADQIDNFTCDERQEYAKAINEYRKTARGWDKVVIEIVSENQVRAKDGTTRVFIPLTDEVFEFHQNLGKWFLHFSEPELINEAILPKRNRNLKDRKAAVIYRRGVRVREFESSEIPSIFDYNLNDLKVDESRKVDDWVVRTSAARALRDAPGSILAQLILTFSDRTAYWEHEFDSYGLESNSYENDHSARTAAREAAWQSAVQMVLGDNGVLVTKDTIEDEVATKKGYRTLKVPKAYVKSAGQYGVKTIDKVLSQDDREGRSIKNADPAALAAVDWAWNLAEVAGLTNGRTKPPVKVFTRVMEAGAVTLGFYRDGTVYLNSDITGDAGNQSQQLRVTALEECVHHITQATDNSRDFQDYILNLVVRIAS